MDPRIVFGNNLRQLRKERGLSQEALAERAELHYTYIGSVERGERNISLVNIVRLAHALGVPVVELMAGVDSRDAPDDPGRS